MAKRASQNARKASLIAFGVIALAAFACAVDTTKAEEGIQVADPAAEASRAYKQAISTLSTLTALPSSQTEDSSPYLSHNNNGFQLSSLFPSIQGHGPIASAMRIAMKLLHHPWLPASLTGYVKEELGGGRRKDTELHGKAVKVIDLLQHAADLGHTDALYTLAQISLSPPNSYFPSKPRLGYHSYSTHAQLTGNASSQAMLGFFHSTGYHGVVPIDQAKAQLYLTFAAHGGHKGAQMALGYRYWAGVGVAENCMDSLSWYEDAAEQTMARFLSGPPGGRTLPLAAPKLSDLVGGVFGPGASVASTGLQAGRPVIKTARAQAAGETWEDLLEYYLFNADRGETDFAFRLGKIFYQGSVYALPGGIASGGEGASAIPRDFARARYYFMRIARQVWSRDHGRDTSSATIREENPTLAAYGALAAGYLGRMYLRGEGVQADAATARMWFERGADFNEKESHNGLGIIWRDGLVEGKKDAKKAMNHFTIAAGQELAEAAVNLGKMYYERGDVKVAAAYFETAMRQGSPFEAYHYLAEIQAAQARNNMITPHIAGSSCSVAVSFFKVVTERGVWDEDLLDEAAELWELGTERGHEMAMLRWWIAAERGNEVAQNNLAYVLDQDRSILRFTRFAPTSPSNDTARLALTQWIRSAAQRNVDSLVKVGDYYYHGLGVADEPEKVRWEKAAGYYQSAADTQMSALAMWNLGWMYENGIGVPQDFHLAKRHYDLALETNSEASVPVSISLLKLHARSLWRTLTGRSGGLSIWGEDDEESSRSRLPPPQGRTVEGGEETDNTQAAAGEPVGEIDEYEDGPWYIGKAREEFNKRKKNGQNVDRVRQDDDDPVKWARERRQAEADREGDFGPEDYFDATTRKRDDEDDDFAETMLLVVVCILVSVLLYVRGRYLDRIRREAQQQQAQPGNGGQALPAQQAPPVDWQAPLL
ncbi:HCP-like protein [Fomitopsis serialis]|uniref:HCP-like protein n=1 Tax=Fomitopsis serialis TaxID=139415 RepID=UPI00200725E8|nr:HCP-like protein [Neoantrodia serialis]KAH9922080.1 HCP-like protein [Neoantrodia serialis]